MPKLGTPIMAALLAVAGLATAANANVPGRSYGSYYNNSAAPILQTRSAVVGAPCAVAAPWTKRTIIQPAILPAADPCIYTGPLFRNTLTMPDPCTFLRP